jgi:hypothetical protein
MQLRIEAEIKLKNENFIKNVKQIYGTNHHNVAHNEFSIAILIFCIIYYVCVSFLFFAINLMNEIVRSFSFIGFFSYYILTSFLYSLFFFIIKQTNTVGEFKFQSKTSH